MTETTVFMNNKTQAIRLPKDVALPDDVKRVEIVKVGQSRLVTPSGKLWDSFFDGPATTEDFMSERVQPQQQIREEF
jgi:antitoxin VapB